MLLIVLFALELLILFFLSQMVSKALSQIFYRLTKSQTVTIHLLSIIFLPGVIIHELAHALSASLLFVPVGHIEFFPKITEHGVKLGSVQIAKTDPVRRAIIGFAPVLFGTTLILLTFYYATTSTFFQDMSFITKFAIVFYMVFELANTMFSSHKDVEGTLELLLVILIIAVILYFVGVRVPDGIFLYLNSSEFTQFVLQANLFLLAPLGVNGVVLGVTKLVMRR